MNKFSKIAAFLVAYFSLIFMIQYAVARVVPDAATQERIEHAQQLIAILDSNAHLISIETRERLLIANGVLNDWHIVGMRR